MDGNSGITPEPKRSISCSSEAEILLIRVLLGLNPAHSVIEAVRSLYEHGKDAFEKQRGERCSWSHEWRPRD